MKKTELAQSLTTAAQTLKDAVTARADAVRCASDASAALKHAEAEAARPLSADEVAARDRGDTVRRVMEGSNEQQRKASLREITATEREAEQRAEHARLAADSAYDLAKIDWDLARQLVTVFTAP